MTHSRPRASNRTWIGFTTPSCSEAKRLISKPSATWKEASSLAGSSGSAASAGRQNSNAKHQTPNKPQIPSLRTPDTMERSWPELASSWRNFLPLLGAPLAHPMGEGSGVRARESGEREGVRADVPVHLTSTSGPLQGAHSGVLSLNARRSGGHLRIALQFLMDRLRQI